MTTIVGKTVTVALKPLNHFFCCTLCEGYLRNAHTIPECLHSFCKSCIFRFFLVECNRNCPKCQILLKPRPWTTLIADQKLQDIVDKIFPELEENDEKLEKEFYATHGFKRKASTITGSSTGTDYHMSKSNQKRAKKSSSSSTALTAPCPSNEIKSISELTFQVRPFKSSSSGWTPQIKILDLSYIQTHNQYKIFELRKFLSKRLEVENEEELEILCMDAPMGPELSIHFIQRTFWERQYKHKPLVLRYRFLEET